jgi:Domain of unknown function (DUF4279)
VTILARGMTELVICNALVKPDEITSLLDLKPSSSKNLGDLISSDEGLKFKSNVGIWRLSFPESYPMPSIEEQLEQWYERLKSRSSAFKRLREMGHLPYIDCRADIDILDIFLTAELNASIGTLGIGISIWPFGD